MYRNNNGYNNYDNYGGDNRRGGRGDNGRGSWGRGYDDRDRDMPRPFDINQKVRHIATGITLVVIKYGREQVECRKPDLTSDYFYLYELEPFNDQQNV